MSKNSNWKKALIWSFISFLLIVVSFLNPLKDPDYAGSRFAYNFTFFFPILLLITLTSLVGFIFTIKYLRKEFKHERNYKLVKLLMPFTLLLPALLQILFFVTSLIMMLHAINNPKNHEPEYTSRKIIFNNDDNTIYIHGSLYGQYQSKRTLYISNDSIPIFSPDTLSNYFYKGENKLALFYSQKPDTLMVFIPMGFKIKYQVDFKNRIVVHQIECDEDSISKLIDMYNAGTMDEFFWLTNEQQNR